MSTVRAIEQGQRANDGRFIEPSYESSDTTYPVEPAEYAGRKSAAIRRGSPKVAVHLKLRDRTYLVNVHRLLTYTNPSAPTAYGLDPIHAFLHIPLNPEHAER